MSTTTTSPEVRAGSDTNLLTGRLHIFVAFDWGDEVDLDLAGRLAPAEARAIARRPRTPTSITYKPPPLRFPLAAVPLELPPLGRDLVRAAEATVFDFAAVSVALRVPLRASPADLAGLAGRLSDPGTAAGVIRAARAALEPLHRQLLPAIRKPHWHEGLWEEYFVFQLLPEAAAVDPLLGPRAGWVAGLVRLEDQPLSEDEVAEAVRLRLRYGPRDLFVPDWAAAVLVDREPDCDETLQTIEFANLQLLEYRHIDDRLDGTLATAAGLIREAGQSRLPLWHRHGAPLRVLGELKVEANGLFERTGNVLKLVGDQYLARVYRLLAARFHLREWERGIQHKLDVVEGIFNAVAVRTSSLRSEFMEIIVIVLILVEVILAIFRHS